MREIKYRQLVWDYDDDKFIEWHYWGFINGKFIAPMIDGINPENNHQSQQFTGLKDKNGKEIFDGDILQITDTFHTYPMPVIWHEDCWTLKSDGTYGTLFEWNRTSKVIGNIYENPELLKD